MSVFEVELAVEELKTHKSPGIDQIPSELNRAGGRTIHYERPEGRPFGRNRSRW
jgi:hypothetical protein